MRIEKIRLRVEKFKIHIVLLIQWNCNKMGRILYKMKARNKLKIEPLELPLKLTSNNILTLLSKLKIRIFYEFYIYYFY